MMYSNSMALQSVQVLRHKMKLLFVDIDSIIVAKLDKSTMMYSLSKTTLYESLTALLGEWCKDYQYKDWIHNFHHDCFDCVVYYLIPVSFAIGFYSYTSGLERGWVIKCFFFSLNSNILNHICIKKQCTLSICYPERDTKIFLRIIRLPAKLRKAWQKPRISTLIKTFFSNDSQFY